MSGVTGPGCALPDTTLGRERSGNVTVRPLCANSRPDTGDPRRVARYRRGDDRPAPQGSGVSDNDRVTGWDGVLRGGRVVDPESGLDAIRDVAIGQGRIAAVGERLPPARAGFDVTGLVVTAGFIDLHSYVNDIAGLRLQALDG
jgi:hypothetical protein